VESSLQGISSNSLLWKQNKFLVVIRTWSWRGKLAASARAGGKRRALAFFFPYEFAIFILKAPPNLHPFVLEGLVRTKTFFTLPLGVAYSVSKSESSSSSEIRNYDHHTVGTIDIGTNPSEPTSECRLGNRENPSQPTIPFPSPQYGKAESREIRVTFCWLNISDFSSAGATRYDWLKFSEFWWGVCLCRRRSITALNGALNPNCRMADRNSFPCLSDVCSCSFLTAQTLASTLLLSPHPPVRPSQRGSAACPSFVHCLLITPCCSFVHAVLLFCSLNKMKSNGISFEISAAPNRLYRSPPAPMNHVKKLKGPEVPLGNWYNCGTNHFHQTSVILWNWKAQPDWVMNPVTHDFVRRIRFWRIKISGTWF